MPLTIPDETLHAANMSEQEMKIEIACRLYDAGKLHLWPAAQLAGMGRYEFEEELVRRGLPVYRYTAEDFRHDVEALDRVLGVRSER